MMPRVMDLTRKNQTDPDFDEMMSVVAEYLRAGAINDSSPAFAKPTYLGLIVWAGGAKWMVTPYRDGEATAVEEMSDLYSLEELEGLNLGSLTPVVEGFIHESETIVLGGRPKVGKSRIVHQLALSLVDAQPFLGMAVPTPRRVLLLDLENGGRGLEGSSRVFLIGAPGSGKSTLVSFLANGCAVGKHGLSWPKRALPFVITVREMKDAAIDPEWIASHLGIAPELVIAALGEKRAVLLVDGMDEAPEELRRRLVVALARLTSQYTQMPVIVTSRPAGAPGEIESCLPRFLHFRLTDFTDDEVNSFVDKWCRAAERSARPDSAEAQHQASL